MGPVIGDPAALYTPNGQQHIFYRRSDQGIYHTFYTPGNSEPNPEEQWGEPGQADGAIGDPAAMNSPDQQHIFYVSGLTTMTHVFYDPSRGRVTEQWARNGSATAPSAMYESSNGQQHVFYRGDDGGLYQVFFDPTYQGAGAAGQLGVRDPELWFESGVVVGNPSTMYTPGQQHVFFRDTNELIWQLFYDEASGERRGPEQWVGPQQSTAGPVAASNPATMYGANGQQHLFYRGVDNGIYQVFYDPGSNSLHGPEHWASNARGNPATMYTPNRQQHVFYRDESGNIWQVFYDEKSGTRHAPEQWGWDAAGDPVTLYSDNGQQHLFYRDRFGNIWHAFYDPSSGRNAPELWVYS